MVRLEISLNADFLHCLLDYDVDDGVDNHLKMKKSFNEPRTLESFRSVTLMGLLSQTHQKEKWN